MNKNEYKSQVKGENILKEVFMMKKRCGRDEMSLGMCILV
jgi:hypothetical protein